jgi:hypothetical protein
VTKRQEAKIAKAERLVRDAVALLDSVSTELGGEYGYDNMAERAPIVHAASGLEKSIRGLR